jgi:hypothetical protein
MIPVDPSEFVHFHRQDLLAEAERDRVAGQLPRRTSTVRRDLALLCFRLASWLDGPVRYVRQNESGDEDWVAPWASV